MIVYALIDPRTREVRYVGETIRTARSRLAQHIRTAKGRTTPPVNAWMRGLIDSGLAPEMIEIEEFSDREGLYEAEAYWIGQFRAMGARLLNIAPGGSTRVGYRHSDETKRKWRECRRGENHPMYGKRRTPDQKEVFRAIGREIWKTKPHPNLGKKRPPETVERMRAARAGRPISAEHKAALAAGSARRWERQREANRREAEYRMCIGK